MRASVKTISHFRRGERYAEKAFTYWARGAWFVFDRLNRIRPRMSFTPRWSDKPVLKSWEKTKPPLGWPRETDSLCPKCVPEIRKGILEGSTALSTLLNSEAPGQIKAHIIERDGKILMVKDCPKHGHFEDVISTDPDFSRHLEQTFPGRDIRAHNDGHVHHHGASTIQHGRGSVLTVDLTNRCNMMCDPCFMDANQVGFVHELTWNDIKTLLDNAIQVKPKRQMSVLFSGGEPTVSPYFLEAVGYARQVGYQRVQAATNGIEFAKSPEFCKQVAAAGLTSAYLQFDGIGNAANSHRHVGNLFDVKLRAMENLSAAGVDIVPVTTIINGINNEQVGRIIEFALDNTDRITFLSFQPVSFTGRDEEISDVRRMAQRYTMSHLAHDVKKQTGLGEPVRDWFPISFTSIFSDWCDQVSGPHADWGQVSCGCHPNCGAGMGLLVDKETKEAVPISAFINVERFSQDIVRINDAARGKWASILGGALALLRNYDPFKAPTHLTIPEVVKLFYSTFGVTGKGRGQGSFQFNSEGTRPSQNNRWTFFTIAGMWFQDLFNYDFRRTEQCIIPYATQEGEISFCAYNTGVGWRKIIEKMHMTATLTKWYEEHGRHEIFAGGKSVSLNSKDHSLVLREEIVTQEEQKDLDERGIPKYAREEKLRARDEKLRSQANENARMAKLYRKYVLKEPDAPDLVQIESPKHAVKVEEQVELLGKR